MSVERIEMANLIGYINDLDRISIEIIKCGNVHIVNALNEINKNDFIIAIPDKNINTPKDHSLMRIYNKYIDYESIDNKLNELMEIFNMEKYIKRKYTRSSLEYCDIDEKINFIYEEVLNYQDKLDNASDELAKMQGFQENIKNIRSVNLDFGILNNQKFFNFKIGKLSKENYDKLKLNIENILSIIFDVNSIHGYQVILSLTPKVLEVEVDRVFRSLNFEELKFTYDMRGTPEDIIKELDYKIVESKNVIKGLNKDILNLKSMYMDYIDETYSRIKLFEEMQRVNSDVACTNEFFFMAGWVPESQKKRLQKTLEVFGERAILIFKPESQVSSSITTPTRLKNNPIIRPFEALVSMYGIPSYNEVDPTTFLAISYMIMYGFMFGDVGQGCVFFLAGLFLEYIKHRPNLGGVLSRLGISSMIFGVLFGSIFGNEEIIKPLLIHPMENTNTMYTVLLGGIALGIAFTSVGFILNLINALKRNDIEDGVFGKHGIVGLIFYWIILLTALNIYKMGRTILPLPLVIGMLCLLLALMVFKQPITNIIHGHRPLYDVSMGEYYIESGFGVFETLLSMLSNTISFIRVGAFALNHAGLFIAFITIANLMKSSTGSIVVLIIGNIIVISLEGLVVFIQGLRLEYYELFSKYYEGSGIEYSPVRLQYNHKNSDLNISKNINQKPVQTKISKILGGV